MRSLDALRSLTCNCDCKLLTTATRFGLRQYSTSCIHPAQRCITTWQVTDRIFEIETAALAQCTCMLEDSGKLLANVASAYPSVHQGWIFWVLAKAGLPAFLHCFLEKIYDDSTTAVEHACQVRGHFAIVRGCVTRIPCWRFSIYNGPSSEGRLLATVVADHSMRLC